MAGVSTQLLWTYLTPRRVLRYQIDTADTGPADVGLPVIHADIASKASASAVPATTGPTSGFGSNTTIMLYVGYTPSAGNVRGILDEVLPTSTGDDPRHADIRVWHYIEEEGVGYSGDLEGADSRYCLVHEQSVVCDTVIRLEKVPAGKYVVTVDFLSSGAVTDTNTGTVTIFEQHSE